MSDEQLCCYGCGQIATHQFKNGKWCCSISWQLCPNKSLKGLPFSIEHRLNISKSKKGKTSNRKGFNLTKEHKNKISKANKGKIRSIEVRMKLSKCRIGHKSGMTGKKHKKTSIDIMKMKLKNSIRKIKIKYSTFSKVEEMRYNPLKPIKQEIQVHCKNNNCKNSKEQDGWFTPTYIQLYERIRQLENSEGSGGCYFYCCDECKQKCPLFNMRPTSIINQNNLPDKLYYTQSEYQIWRNEVLKRSDHICEYCGEKATDAHHSRPQKSEPFYSLDPDYGIACCQDCHYKYGHKDECSTGKLANKVCMEEVS